MVGIYSGEPTDSFAINRLGTEAVSAGTGEVVAARFGQGLAANPLPRLFREAGRAFSTTGIIGVDDFGRTIEIAPDPVVDVDTLNKEFALPGLKFDQPVTRDVAQDLYDHHRDELVRQDVINRGKGGFVEGALGLGANLAAGLLDPLNLAVGLIPIAGEARFAQLGARALGRVAEPIAATAPAAVPLAARLGETFGIGSAADRAAVAATSLERSTAQQAAGEATLRAMSAPERAALRFAAGGAQGAAGMAALEPLQYALSKQEHEDYTMADSLRNIALGTIIGGGMHAGIGGLIDWKTGRYRNPVSQALEEAGPDARQGLLQGTLGQTIDGQPVNVKPFLDLVPNPMRLGETLDEPQPGVSRYPLMRDDIRVGTADISVVEGGKTAMANIVDGPRQLGLPEIRGLAREFFTANPEVDTIRGFRGGREVGALTREDLMRPVETAARGPGAPVTMAADGPLIGAWHDVPVEIRDLLADVLEGKLKRTGTLAARDIPTDIANQIGTGSFQTINRVFASDPARAIQILRHIGEDNNQGAGPTAAASFDPLVLHRQGELTAARAAEIAGMPPEQLQAAGADPEMWKVVADNLTKAEGSREGAVGVVTDQMQYMPADGVPKTASEREAVAVIARALDAEAARGGDVRSLIADADAAYRAAGHGTPPDIGAAEAAQRVPLEGGIAGAEYRKLIAAGVPEEEARVQGEFTQRRYEARAARSPLGETAEQLYRREGEETTRGQAGELAEGELGQAPNETKGHPEGDAEDAAWRRIEPEKTSTGKYRGAPAWVTNGRRLGQLRKLIRQLIDEGVTGRFWYEDSAKKILQITRGNLPDAERFMGLLAIYSPQTAVFVNTQFAIKAFRQWKAGEPINVKTGAQDTRAQAWLDHGEDWGGRKTNSFYLNLMHEIITEYPEAVASLNLPPDILTEIRRATVDLWVLRAMGHEVDAAGGEGDTNKYGFSQNEIKRAAGMLNQDLAVGERRWLPHQVQAALWSAVKARYELPAVKEATWAESLKKGFAKMLPDENGKLVRSSPEKSGSDKAGHMAVWRKHALAASPEDVARQIESARGSFSDAIDRIAQNVTGEAVPSASLGHAINNATPEAKRQFTHDALQLLIDDDGNDVLAAQLGVNLNFNHIGAGLFEGNINPTVVTTLVPEKPPGFFDKTKARQYARAWQYIFKQDAVPIFRAEATHDFTGDYAAHSASGATLKRFDTQGEAQAFADERSADRPKQDGKPKRKGQETTISGGDLALGLHLEFANDLDEAAQRRLADALIAELGPDVGFTKTGDRDAVVVNFRGDGGLPKIDDQRFAAALQKIAAEGDIKLSKFGSDGEYGPVHDWQAERLGPDPGLAGGSPAFQSWVADRAAAFDALLDQWSDPAAAHAAAIAERDRIAGTGAGDTGAIRPDSGGQGGSRSLEQASRVATEAAAGEAGLAGLPVRPVTFADGTIIVPGPFARAKQAAVDYMRKAGLLYDPPRDYVPVDVPRATRIAQAFEDMQHAPDDPAVLASYEAMAKETLAQWEAIKETGLKVEWIKEGQEDPYKDNPRRAMADVIDNNHWWGFPTDLGYGTGDVTERANNPMLRKTGEVIDGREVVVNDIFRIVHDYFGHIKEGLGFRAGGEENAWRQHAAMYSDEARGAMTAETRGQNSWVNYGPHGETNRTANAAETVYSPQKIGLLPDWVENEGRVSVPPTELEQACRAKVRLSTETERALITLYEGTSDPSSLIHEKFHIYVDQLFKDAALENASPQFVQDAATLRREVGAKEGEPLTTEQLEQLATWGEQYAREGKAPTPELTGVFERFKQWMMDIYEDIKSLGIPINDDVRGVFDRMFTTPEQEARARGGAGDANASFRTEGRPAVEASPVTTEPTGRPAGEPRPTDTLNEINQHAAELEQMQQRLVPEEKLSAESRTEMQSAREATIEAEGQASALERAALCIMRG